MPVPSGQRYRLRLTCLVVVAAALAAAGAGVRARRTAIRTQEEAAGVYSCERAGFRYEFHAPSGSERLYDLARDPHCLVDVLRDNEALAAQCRRSIAERAGAGGLGSLEARYADAARRLKELGYL